ncbi:hypothetical protein ABIA00_000157 [Bradyrhizobium ottawaense]|uniref:hypothetical protein n=1 Tax=Bradyrhizobium ottawaense TaxID=931866 RepID=UPI003834D45C
MTNDEPFCCQLQVGLQLHLEKKHWHEQKSCSGEAPGCREPEINPRLDHDMCKDVEQHHAAKVRSGFDMLLSKIATKLLPQPTAVHRKEGNSTP